MNLHTPAAPATIEVSQTIANSPGYWSTVGSRLMRDKVTLFFGLLLVAIVLAAILAPWISPTDPYKANILRRLKDVGYPGHPLGTDQTGRDMLARLLYGGRLSLFMGVTPVAIALVIGGLLGVLAGYAGGALNMGIMRTMDVFYAFPSVLLAIAISGALGAGIGNAILSLSIVFVPPIARVAETITTQVRTLDYVEAARASGAASLRIIRIHVLSNVLGAIFVYATSLISVSIILASGLSFLGLGTKPPEPEWGLMLNELRQAIYVTPYVAALPGVMIFLTSLSFNLLSDGLRSAMDLKS